MHSWRLVKHGELPTRYLRVATRYLRVATRYLRVATILKETSHEFLRHLTSLLRHSYEYPRVPTTYIIGMSCRTRRALQLTVLKWAGHGRSTTRTDLVACRTELVVMLWDVMHSWRLVKHGELPTRYLRVATRYLRVATRYLRVATILKETSHEFLRHLTSLLRHSYEYPRVPTTYIIGMSCRTRRALQLVATRATIGEL